MTSINWKTRDTPELCEQIDTALREHLSQFKKAIEQHYNGLMRDDLVRLSRHMQHLGREVINALEEIAARYDLELSDSAGLVLFSDSRWEEGEPKLASMFVCDLSQREETRAADARLVRLKDERDTVVRKYLDGLQDLVNELNEYFAQSSVPRRSIKKRVEEFVESDPESYIPGAL